MKLELFHEHRDYKRESTSPQKLLLPFLPCKGTVWSKDLLDCSSGLHYQLTQARELGSVFQA